MTKNLKKAFSSICAGDNLKSNTKSFLRKEILRREKTKSKIVFRRYAIGFSSLFIFVLSAVFTYNIYFTPFSYVDVDVNPSIELTLNRFNYVIAVDAYNEDGDNIIEGLSLAHKDCDDALFTLMEAMTQQGYFQDGGLVSVTLLTNNKNKESELLSLIQADVNDYISGHHHTTQIDIFSVSSDTRNHSHAQGVSPAKYLAIQELIEVDPTTTIENCRGRSISEIKRLTKENSNHHSNKKGHKCR